MAPSTASEWAAVLQQQLGCFNLPIQPDERSIQIDEVILQAPRRRSANSATSDLAKQISRIMYPIFPDGSLGAIIQYEKDVVKLRSAVIEQRKRTIEENTRRRGTIEWRSRIRKQGPWNPVTDPLSLKGAPGLPMPVEIAKPESLVPFFDHLALGGSESKASTIRGADAAPTSEPGYDINLLEFEKGVLYCDQRMDLCKMVLGPNNISALMEALKTNEFVTHFLLGNNIIGPHGVLCIANFLKEYPNRMDTWYLAGNCIDTPSFGLLVDELIKSTSVTNIWLKRNPLGSAAAFDVFRLITQTANLRTLDLDQTELGDDGVEHLFNALVKYDKPIALRNVYLNAVGIGKKAATAIAKFLASPHCLLDALYMSNNPMDVTALAVGLRQNKSLTRLVLSSVGLGDHGVEQLCMSLHDSNVKVLDIGQSYATKDLDSRYNWVTDDSASALSKLLSRNKIHYLSLGYCAMTHEGLTTILNVIPSTDLLYFFATTIFPQSRDAISIHLGQGHAKAAELAHAHILRNIQKTYGTECTYGEFMNNHKRWLVNDKTDVRKIDSVYRNRDAGLARRGLKKLDKWWDEGDETLKKVMGATGSISVGRRVEGAVGPVCTRRR